MEIKQSVPDVGDIVKYSQDTQREYRVVAWVRTVSSAQQSEIETDELSKVMFYGCRMFSDGKGGMSRMQRCLREEATHLMLASIGGTIAPVEQCEVIGTVNWGQHQLDKARSTAIRHGQSHMMIV